MRCLRFGIFVFIIAMCLALPSRSAQAQTRIDDTIAFQTDPAKKYSIYVPSTYSEGTQNKLILAFHPLHAFWGNSTQWCTTLTEFAEANDLLMVCPDGGNDGRVDDAIDKSFSTALLDSMETWYTVDTDRVFVLGFSWGARAAYTYGLANVERFAGFMTIGAFIQGTNQVGQALIDNSEGKPFYIMHGDSDLTVNLANGFFPIRDALVDAGAVVNSLILQGVGHTIDFPNRNQILTDAFQWVEATSNGMSVGVEALKGRNSIDFDIYPNPAGSTLHFNSESSAEVETVAIQIFDIMGRRVLERTVAQDQLHTFVLDVEGLAAGPYWVRLSGQRFWGWKSFVVQ